MILTDMRGWEVCKELVQGHFLLVSLSLLGRCHEKVSLFSEVLARRGFQSFKPLPCGVELFPQPWASPTCTVVFWPFRFAGVPFGV